MSKFDHVTRSEIEAAAAHLAAVVGASSDAIISKTLDGVILSWNPGATRIFGYGAEEMIGQPIMRLIPPDRAQEEIVILARLKAGERFDQYETVRVARDGRKLDVSVTISPIYNASGEIVAASKIVRDITDRKRAIEREAETLKAHIAEQTRIAALLQESEARVRAINLELERRVGDQTAELRAANAYLTDALEQRSSALAQRDILLREVYHRVKNNLQMVDALLVAESRHLGDAEAASALFSLRQRIYALGLVHQQLMELRDLKTFDIAPFLRELADKIVRAAGKRGVNVAVNSIPLAVGLDFAIPIGLLVTELLTNSLKHAFPTGTGHISVLLRRDAARKLVLIISDDGQGRPNGPTSREAAPGLGMKIIAGLVAQLNGVMTARSENGMRTEIQVDEPATS